MNTNKHVEQENVTAPNRQNWGLIRRILAYVAPYKTTFILGLFFLLLSTATTLAIPYLASQFADITTIPAVEQTTYLQRVGLLMLGVLVLQGIFSYFRIVLFTIVSEKSMADLRRDIYNKIISLALPFFEERRIGELTSRITADVTQLQTAISINLAEILRQVATIIAGIVIILMTSFRLTLVMLATFPVGILAAVFFGKYIRKLSRQTQDALADSNIIVEESLQSIQAVKAYTNEWYEAKRYKNSLDHFVAIAIQTSRYRGLFVSFLITVVFGGIILVLWFGANYVKDGMMTIGELLRFILYTGFIGGSVAGTADLFSNLQKAMGAAEKVFGILDEKPEVQHLTQQHFPPINGNIDYQNVVFHYPTRPDLAILKGISLHIEQGKKVALVGASGAGKSTIVQLLMGFYRPTSGSISIDNRSITDYDLTALRQNIGIVPQDVVLFGGTIAENIRYGKPDATNEAVIAAARQANAYDFIMGFPQGMETMVGERGIKLSGGQRQRIAIARALLKNPNILILDEATSSLDSESESLVQAALEQLMHNRTTIIIAHRLATVRNADQIYVIDQGQIAEQGTHEQLLQHHEGIYHNLIKLQFEHA
ncbi:MAG: ATP-binding cassette domain-containing protein [Chitinophagales bacterium]|nr:ATP-binding cassette domain-containing protein [Chitinophagales bacterium]